MKKVAEEIEDDVFAILNASPLKAMIKGKIYPSAGIRPLNATTEDAVISFLTGIDGQFQIGVVTINIYVPDIDTGQKPPKPVKDKARCRAIAKAANTLIGSLKPSNYRFSLASMIQSFPVEGISQHFVNIQLKFELKTF